MRLLAAIVVVAIAVTLAFAAGYKTAERRCISAPVNGTIATWCTADWPPPTSF